MGRFKLVSSEISHPGTGAQTVLQVVAAANHGIELDHFSVSFKGTDATGVPVEVLVLRQTSAGTMSAKSPVKDPDDWAETMQTTGQENATAEPTAGDILDRQYIHPHGGGYTYQAPFGKNIKVGGGDRVGIRVNASAAVTVTAEIFGEE